MLHSGEDKLQLKPSPWAVVGSSCINPCADFADAAVETPLDSTAIIAATFVVQSGKLEPYCAQALAISALYFWAAVYPDCNETSGRVVG